MYIIYIFFHSARFFKAMGSLITFQSHGSINALRSISELPNIILSLCLIVVTYSVGTEFEQYIQQNYIVGSGIQNANNTTDSTNTTTNNDNSNSNNIIISKSVQDLGFHDMIPFEGAFAEDDYDTSSTYHS